MDDNDDATALRRALEDVIDDALMLGWTRVLASAERAVALWTDPDDGGGDASRVAPEARRALLH